MVNGFSWHREYYDKAVKQLVIHTDQLLMMHEESLDGWVEWFENNFPDQYKKYASAVHQVNTLWGKTDSKSMEEFKKAVKVEMDASKWAATKYLEHQEQQAREEQMKGTQEALVL